MKIRFKSISNNSKSVIINAINSVGIKGCGIVVALLTTPAYLRYFNDNAVLGVWFTILSILSWILNFDLGIGNGLRNRLVTTFVKNDEMASKKYISSAYIFLTATSFALGLLIFVAIRLISWNKFFNIGESRLESHILQNTILIILISIMLQFVLRIISSILYALQKAFLPNFMSLLTNIILLVYVLICNNIGINNNIISLAIVYLIAVNAPLIVATILIFSKKLKKMRPNINYFDLKYAIDTLKVGGAFLGLQIEAMIINNTSIFLITWLLGSELVVEYNIYFKVFSLVSTVFSLITIPIWSAVTKAKEEENIVWIKKATRILQLIAVIFVIGEILIIPLMQMVFNIWLKEKSFQVDYIIMAIFVVEQGIVIWSAINATICNGLSELKSQFALMTIGAILIIPIAIILTKLINGYYAVTLAHIIALIPYCVGQSIWIERYIKRNT
ncbi:hypothetical protein [Clostridium sp. YIM B02506]|uniref:hypothetical protein n=1 Tax=Clostridium sp. YIM B02506 TaxID=2910680 RepID=UPI001EEF6D17|nr:hypothetical protein [Clostridium sp. YIM B02506]